MTAPKTDARTTAVRWRVAAADATGAHHVARHMRYEDAWAVAPATVLDRDEPSVVVAVAIFGSTISLRECSITPLA